jgi:hypothetical protein
MDGPALLRLTPWEGVHLSPPEDIERREVALDFPREAHNHGIFWT